MDRRERYEDHIEAIRAAQEGHQANIWTATPGIIVSFDPKAMTAVVQPAVQGAVRTQDGTISNYTGAHCLDVPVHYPAGGGFSLTHPIAKGDECLLVFGQRCIDNWWAKGGVQPQAEWRMHDPSDGFAIMGFRSKPRVLSGLSTETVQLRSDDGQTFVEIDGNQTVRLVAPTKVRLETPLLEVTGAIKAGAGSANEVGLQTHTHQNPAAGKPTPGS